MELKACRASDDGVDSECKRFVHLLQVLLAMLELAYASVGVHHYLVLLHSGAFELDEVLSLAKERFNDLRNSHQDLFLIGQHLFVLLFDGLLPANHGLASLGMQPLQLVSIELPHDSE